mmetsp:Transcript_27705/g.68490  ORF Transcript_27705/g.68490 Transcript_27705/m.68490 type:complete len:324 (+) Transcript_27705:85-1056(+)
MLRTRLAPAARALAAALRSSTSSTPQKPGSRGSRFLVWPTAGSRWEGGSGWRQAFSGAACVAFAASLGGAGALCAAQGRKDERKAGYDRKVLVGIVRKADEMFEQGDYLELLTFLEGKGVADAVDPELLWRFARALYDVADKTGLSDKAAKQALVERAMSVIESALVGGAENFAVRKWYGIILNKVGEYQGTKATIKNSFVVREHWEAAARLAPGDATSRALLGEWCMGVAGLSAITRSVASAIFASPPTATYKEALQHFIAAENIQPGFWLKNQLNIAKCCVQVKDSAQARVWLEKALETPASSDEDREVQKEAKALLAKVK